REPGVDDEDRTVRLVDGHVLADLAEAAHRDDAADAHRRGVYARSLRCQADAVASSPDRSRQERICASSPSSGSTIGSRCPPTSWPVRLSAALIGIGFTWICSRSYEGCCSSCNARAPSTSPSRWRRIISAICEPQRCAVTDTTPTPPSSRNAKVFGS